MQEKILHRGDSGRILFWCPGCRCAHFIIEGRWYFDGNEERPTFSPSILVKSSNADGDTTCHSFVKDGEIEFLGDCTHALAGKTVPMEPF